MAFFKAARQGVKDVTLPTDRFIVDFKRDPEAISRVLLSNGTVHAYVLPSSVSTWPSFRETKQEEEPNLHIFFQRMGPSSIGRFEETVKLLCEDETVVVTGLSGTGKSTEVNAMLMLFLRHLGTEGWPNKVAYRYDDEISIFSFDEKGNPSVTCMPCKTLDVAKDVSKMLLREWQSAENNRSSKPVRPVLFLEVGEDEKNPQSALPTLVYLSNRLVKETTKTWSKEYANYFLFDPP